MKIHDISQELFGSVVFKDDPAPKKITLLSMAKGDKCNLSALSMCAHNGTHVDSPAHFIADGKTIDQTSLDHFVGDCYVSTVNGDVTEALALETLEKAKNARPGSEKRILFRGKATVTAEAAHVFVSNGVLLVGNESQTVGPEDAPMKVHKILLGAGLALLEGVRLAHVSDGAYLLNAAPINLGGCEGSPCRALLIET